MCYSIEMTLDRSANHSDDQGSFHEVVGFCHLHNLSFYGLYGFQLLNASVWHFICLTSQFLYERKVF